MNRMDNKYRIIHPGRIAAPSGADLANQEAIVTRLNEMHSTIERVKEWADNHAFTETNWENRVVLSNDILKALSESEASS